MQNVISTRKCDYEQALDLIGKVMCGHQGQWRGAAAELLRCRRGYYLCVAGGVAQEARTSKLPWGFGRYNVAMLSSCCLLVLAMYLDIFGFSVALPAAACDLRLSAAQQGLLSAVPLIGVMVSSFFWGLCADTCGRRRALLLAMPIGAALGLAAALAPGFASLAALKFLSAGFTSSANAAAFVLVGETTPRRHRGRAMFLLAAATMLVQFVICVFALPVFQLSFRLPVSWLSMEYRPWRLLLHLIVLPGALGAVAMLPLHESPKFLLSRGRAREAGQVLRAMQRWNGGTEFKMDCVFLEEAPPPSPGSLARRAWAQTAPLFRPPLLKRNLQLYYLLLCAYMTSTGYTMWVPTMTNAYFDGDDRSGQTFCEVASGASSNSTYTDCDNVIQPFTLYAVMCYSGASGTLTVLLSLLVGPLGKKRTTILVFAISAVAGVILLFVKVPLLSIALFYVFLYVALILGNINTYLVEMNPTYLRGMATCLSVVAARGLGFGSVQLIAALLARRCRPVLAGYVALVLSGLVVSLWLPPDLNNNTSDEISHTPGN